MAAYDNVSLPSPPNIATAGNYAQMLMQGLSNLGDAYQSGQNFQYQQKQRNLFQNGIPTNANGQPDFYAMLQKMVQAGGSPVAGQVLPMLQKQPFLDAALQDYKNEIGQGANIGPASSPAGASPQSITGPTNPTKTATTNGGDTVNSLAAEHNIDLDAFLPRYPGVRSLLNRDLTPQQAKAVAQRMADFKNGGGGQNVANPGGGLVDEGNTNQGTPSGVGGSSPISPAPTAASGGVAPRQPLQVTVRPNKPPPSTSFDDRFAASGYTPASAGGAASMVPAGVDPLAYAEALKKRAEALRRQANTQGIIGIPTKPKEDQALALDKQADAILEQLGKPSNITPEMRNVGAVPGGQPAEALKHEIESGQKEFDSINELGDNARQSSQKLRLAQAFVNSDEYYSGPVEQLNRKFKQWAATMGGDPNAGTPQEAMVKSINDLLAEQVRAMAKSGVGRVLMTEVQTMRDSIASQKITPATNRLLLEEVSRVHKAQMEIQDAANLYVKQHGHIDSGFRQLVTQYYHDHPMFTDDEIKDPRLIAPPVAPAGMDATAAKQWAKSRGLAQGDPVRTQDGRIIGAP